MKTVTSIIGNLEWQYADDGVKRMWEQAVAYANSLGNGWRLPTIHELFSLVDVNRFGPACVRDIKCKPESYWSNDVGDGHPDHAWGVDFYNGYVGWLKKHNGYLVRCVRDLPK